MSKVVEFPDRPENVEALRAMVEAVRAAMGVGFDRDKFVRAAGLVYDGVVLSDATQSGD